MAADRADGIDALAVMDAAAIALAIYCPESDDAAHNEMVEARAAVAELLNALADFDGMAEPSMPGTPPKLRRLREAYARMEPQS